MDKEPTILGPDGEFEPGEVDPEAGSLVPLTDQPPTVLPALILDDLVPFPGPVAPILLDSQIRRDAVLHAKNNNGFFLLINRSPAFASEIPSMQGPTVTDVTPIRDDLEDGHPERSEDPQLLRLGELNDVGVVARVVRVFQMPDDRLSGLVQLVRRAQPIEILKREPFPVVRVLYPAELVGSTPDFDAVFRQLRLSVQSFFEAHPSASDELKVAALSIEQPGLLADFVGQHLARDTAERLAFLSELEIAKRVRRALEVTVRELDLLTIGNRISEEIRSKVEKHQREFFLREQLKAIRTELGEEKDASALAQEELEQKLKDANLPDHAKERAEDELKRLAVIPAESPEHHLVRSYLEWIASLPWSETTEDHTDLGRARKILDEDHYGLEEVKERIIEYLAVRQLNPNAVGTLLAFAGPPGVGKTSLGQSIARALGRKFYRFSVGGMRDEAEIKGHRRTYVGAMPGRILQALKQVETANPVVMLDELDKMGSDWRGDPSSAMLEVLDPAQNKDFLDHYLDLPFDLSRVMFIATANVKTEIPGPLLDRLEVIDLAGYIPAEKLEIAMRYLVPRQRKEHGLTAKQFRLGRKAVSSIIARYTQEAGVRELNRQVEKLARKRATEVVEGKEFATSIAEGDLTPMLGPPKVAEDRFTKRPPPGVALGLAWTPVGGDVLFIEVIQMAGKGNVKVTGQLGDVMSESASLAMSYVRNHAAEFGIDPELFTTKDFHIHFPAGAVKKDGPSAGVTITTALISSLTGKSVKARLAMTGEMTLRGEVLPVGGIREKIVAAKRYGVRTVIVPERNEADVEEIPESVRKNLKVVVASKFDDVMDVAFGRAVKTRAKPTPKVRRRPRSKPVEGSRLRVVSNSAQRKGRRKKKAQKKRDE